MKMEEIIGLKKLIIQEAECIMQDCTYSAKGHWNDAAIWRKVHYTLGVSATILTASAGSSAAKVIIDSNYAPALAFLATIITAILTFIKPEEKANQHSKSGCEFNALKSNVRMFKDIEVNQTDDTDALATKLRTLSDERNKLNKESLPLSYLGYILAKIGIKKEESCS